MTARKKATTKPEGPGMHRIVPSGLYCNTCKEYCWHTDNSLCVCCVHESLKARIAHLEAELALFVKCDYGTCKPDFEHEYMNIYHKGEK